MSSSAKGKSERLCSRVQKFNLEGSILDAVLLANELV